MGSFDRYHNILIYCPPTALIDPVTRTRSIFGCVCVFILPYIAAVRPQMLIIRASLPGHIIPTFNGTQLLGAIAEIICLRNSD